MTPDLIALLSPAVKSLYDQWSTLKDYSSDKLKKMPRGEFFTYADGLSDFQSELNDLDQKDLNESDVRAIQQMQRELSTRIGRAKDVYKNYSKFLNFFTFGIPDILKAEEPEKPQKIGSEQQEHESMVRAEMQRIQEERSTRSQDRFQRTSVIGEFLHSLIPPLLPIDAAELRRKQETLDRIQAEQNLETDLDVAGAINKIKNTVGNVVSVLGEFAEETTGGIAKVAALTLGWPIVLPVKLVNRVLWAAKHAFCAVDGIVGMVERGFSNISKATAITDPWSGAANITKNLLKSAVTYPAKGISLLAGAIRTIPKALSVGCRFLERYIDSDKWLKDSPIASGFILGALGTLLVAGIALASIFTLGLPIAAVAVGAACAATGAFLWGYFKAKARAKELTTLQLAPGDQLQLEKYEYETQPETTVEVAPQTSQPHTATPVVPNPNVEGTSTSVLLEHLQQVPLEHLQQVPQPQSVSRSPGQQVSQPSSSVPKQEQRSSDEPVQPVTPSSNFP